MLSCIPTFFLSLFKISMSISEILEKIMRDFLCEGVNEGAHLVEWEVVSKPLDLMGLELVI